MGKMGLSHLLDPLVGGDFLSSILPLILERRDQQQMRSDPNILGFINNLIGDYNASNAYNPETGQFNAGSPFGDAASGHGGAYGSDRNGNPLSPFQFNTQYGLSQLQGSQGGLDAGIGNLARVAEQAGVAAPGGFSLNVPSGIDPGAVQGVDQSVRNVPTPLSPLQPAGGALSGNNGGLLGLGLGRGGGRSLMQDFVGSFAVGTTSVPRTGLAQVHQGEAIVPAAMNPMAGAPSRPMAAPGGGLVPQAPQTGMSAPRQPGAPAIAGGTPALPAPQFPSYGALTPGLSPEVQAQLVNRGTETIDTQSQALQRQMATAGAMSGQGGSGALARRMFDAELARSGQVAGLQRDVGLEAANRQFTDQLAANNFGLQRYQVEGQLGQGQQALNLQDFIQRGQLGQGQQALNLQDFIQRGQLGQGQQALDLQQSLQQGQLGQGQQRIDLDRTLGMGQLGVQQGQLGQGQQRIDLDRTMGLGQLGVQQGQLALQGELGRGGLANDTMLAQLQQQLGLGQLGQGQQRLDLDRTMGMGQLGVQQGQLANDTFLAQLQQQLGLGGLANDRRGLDIQQQLGMGGLANDARGLDIQSAYNQGNLANDARGLGIQEQLGLGNLANDRFGLETNRTLGQGELGRNLANDAFGQYQYGQNRNDALAQQDFTNQLQQWGLQQNQNQFGQLLGLLGQFPGQSSGGGGTGTGGGGLLGGGNGGGGLLGGGGGNGFAPFGGFFQNLFGLN